MSNKASSRVWDFSSHRGSALVVMLGYADWADDWGYVCASNDVMSKKTKINDERNFRRVKVAVMASNEIRVVRQGGTAPRDPSVLQVVVGMSAVDVVESEKLSPMARDVFETNATIHEIISNQKTRYRTMGGKNDPHRGMGGKNDPHIDSVVDSKKQQQRVLGGTSAPHKDKITPLSKEKERELNLILKRIGFMHGPSEAIVKRMKNEPKIVRGWFRHVMKLEGKDREYMSARFKRGVESGAEAPGMYDEVRFEGKRMQRCDVLVRE